MLRGEDAKDVGGGGGGHPDVVVAVEGQGRRVGRGVKLEFEVVVI